MPLPHRSSSIISRPATARQLTTWIRLWNRAVANGVKNLVVQPTHLMHGAEYDELMEAVDAYKDKFESVKVAEPLLGEVGAVLPL